MKDQRRIENRLTLKRLGIDSYGEAILFVRADSLLCRSEGFEARTRVLVRHGNRSVVATINVIHSDILTDQQASLSEGLWVKLGANEGDHIGLFHLEPPRSLHQVRAKLFGHPLTSDAFRQIISDVVNGVFSDVQLAAFITACSGNRLTLDEATGLTQAMISSGNRIHWPGTTIVDKHCVGGLPGNRTTPIVVSIVTSLGLVMPKTSSRAITSPAGTADTMEVFCPVALSLAQIKRVVEKEGGCVAWGGRAALSPADDILIRVERVLDLDSEGQLVASVLSKKVASGSTHVLIDMPVGETAKVRSKEDAERLGALLVAVGERVGLTVGVLFSDGSQPVGRGIGPELEARDVLQVLQNSKSAPDDLRARALQVAGGVLEMSGRFAPGQGIPEATKSLDSGAAYGKFLAICREQGGFSEPEPSSIRREILSPVTGTVKRIDNRRIAMLAKLAGAPKAKKAGVDFFSPIGKRVEKGQPLFAVHAESPGELEYALAYLEQGTPIVEIEEG